MGFFSKMIFFAIVILMIYLTIQHPAEAKVIGGKAWEVIEYGAGKLFGLLEKEMGTTEKLSPPNRIKESQIKVTDDKVVINIKNAKWSRYQNTNSMDPVLDEEANGIEIIPNSADEIKLGDIISYSSDKDVIVHYVIEKGEDKDGTYFKTKGLNNPVKDFRKVRFEQIRGVLVAIIY